VEKIMQSEIAKLKALATGYMLLVLMVMLSGHALWTAWYLAGLSPEESSQNGLLVRSTPALLMLIIVPPMLWIIRFFAGQLRMIIRQQREIFTLIALCALGIVASTVSLLLAEPYELGGADRAVGGLLLVSLTILVFADLGCSVAIMLDKKAASG